MKAKVRPSALPPQERELLDVFRAFIAQDTREAFQTWVKTGKDARMAQVWKLLAGTPEAFVAQVMLDTLNEVGPDLWKKEH